MSHKIESFIGAAAAAAPVRPVVRSKDGQTAAAAGSAAPRDSVRFTSDAQALAQIEQTARDSTGIDEAKVAELRRQLAEGSYSPDPKVIASRLLQTECSLSARK